MVNPLLFYKPAQVAPLCLPGKWVSANTNGIIMEFSRQDIDTLSRTIWGEARGEGEEGMLAVAHVIVNRANRGGWWGSTVHEVCRKDWQFSVWNENDPNRSKLEALDLEDVVARECHWAALTVALGKHADNTEGSFHYHTHGVSPDWSVGLRPVRWIGNHLFFNNVE